MQYQDVLTHDIDLTSSAPDRMLPLAFVPPESECDEEDDNSSSKSSPRSPRQRTRSAASVGDETKFNTSAQGMIDSTALEFTVMIEIGCLKGHPDVKCARNCLFKTLLLFG